MQKNEPKTNVGLVLAVLDRERGLYLSAREIQEYIILEYCTHITLKLVRSCLCELLPVLEVRIDRIGPKKVDLNLYCLPQKPNENV